MDWPIVLLLIFGGLMLLMGTGLPVAFCFFLVNIVGAFLLWGGEVGLRQLILTVYASVTDFTLIAMPLFILMGEVMFHSGIALQMIDALDKWIGRLPGRLSLLAVAGGTLLASLTGASMGSVAVLGSTLLPEMEKRGYKNPMSLGPILGSGGLAIMIPPSSLAVLIGSLGEIDIGMILIAIIVPGLLMAVLYAGYIISRSWLQPSLAPVYEVAHIHLTEKLSATAKYILPLGTVIFLVVGVIFLGVATPTEAAGLGALGTFLLAAAYGKLSWVVVKRSVNSALIITVMIFTIIAGSEAFGQILAFSGASREMINFVVNSELPPLLVILGMQVILWFLGMFMAAVPIMMITVPIFVPIVDALGFNLVWWVVLFLLNIEMGSTTPPLGLSLFAMKGVCPPDKTMADLYRAALPFLGCDLVALVLILAFPAIALWLPRLMMR